jgi:predicted  nucleic acid-binding Zn-ribbon protein
MSEPEIQNSYKPALIILLLLFICSIAFNIFLYNKKQKIAILHSHEVDSLIEARVAVEKELAIITFELEKYKGIASNLDSLLNNASQTIAAQEQRIRNLITKENNSADLNKKLKAELKKLQVLRDEYLDKIDNLIAENNKLKQEKEELSATVNNLNEQKNKLEGKVLIASELTIEYVKVTAYKKRSNGKFVESGIAKRTNKIETCFTVMDNKIASAGDKMVYLRIVAPNGKVLAGISKTSFTDAQNQQVDATSVLRINYTGEKQNVCLSYENDERILETGTYTIQIYIENKIVHQSSYILK